MLRLLTNPVVLRAVGAFAVAVVVMIAFVWIVRRLRAQIIAEGVIERPRSEPSATDFTLAAYQAVIQKFKDQERELARLRDEERQRAATTEKINTAVLSQLASGVVLFNPRGLVQQANPAAKTIFGYASPLGLHARDLFRGIQRLRNQNHEGSNDALVEALESCAESGKVVPRLEADYTTPQGQRRVIGLTLSPVRDTEGKSVGVACLASDLTEISDLARQMRLRESMASLGEMSAGIAHEFKNSLATISGYAQMLRKENEPATVSEFSGKIAEETANLTRVVTDFLNFARPAEDGVIASERINLAALLRECARGEVELELKDCPSDLEIIGDATAWRQALSNLLRNSAEAAREGELPKVVVIAKEQNGRLEIRLRDNGRGIPAEQLDKVFIPFFTTKNGGTGLGLALVHRIVVQHGGSITAISDDSGTEFTLTLPVAKVAAGA
jgi:PAS domain S-box-containing protein